MSFYDLTFIDYAVFMFHNHAISPLFLGTCIVSNYLIIIGDHVINLHTFSSAKKDSALSRSFHDSIKQIKNQVK